MVYSMASFVSAVTMGAFCSLNRRLERLCVPEVTRMRAQEVFQTIVFVLLL